MCPPRVVFREFAVRSMKFEPLYGFRESSDASSRRGAGAPTSSRSWGKPSTSTARRFDASKASRFDLMVLTPRYRHGLAFQGAVDGRAWREWDRPCRPSGCAARRSGAHGVQIVTLPEEMSVNESIDLYKAATEIGLPRGKVVVNGVYPDFFADHRDELRRVRDQSRSPDGLAGSVARAAIDGAMSSVARREAHQEMIETLAGALPLERVILPFVFRPQVGLQEIEVLADQLEGF